jgi:NAD(P)-dependent dehydrogenase (short-subunit alcohol dehydrogenase family)
MSATSAEVPSMDGKTVVITGGNSGIGKAAAVALAGAGARVVVTARSRPRGESAVVDIAAASGSDAVELSVFDLADLASVRTGAADLLERCERIDVLLNNAGLILSDRTLSADGYESTFAINHLGPFLLTELLLDRLRASAPSRIVNVASTAHNFARRGMVFDDLMAERSYKPMEVYGRSKLANILFTTELAKRLAGSGVTANSLHPGSVATGYARDGDTTGFMAWGVKVYAHLPISLSPEQGARTSVYLCSSPEVEGVTGKYFAKCKEKTPSANARDEEAASRLWEVSEDLVARAATGS